ncbi:MAG: hypothetical protein J2P23_08665 [Microlunatus sp.]|nr:hypothetical protein [Microlunatus sp.]
MPGLFLQRMIIAFGMMLIIVGVVAIFRRSWLITGWRYGRNVPWLIMAWFRWPRLAASSGLGRFRPYKPGGRDRPVNWPGTKGWRLTPAGYSFVVKHKFGQSIDTVRAAIPALSSGMRGQLRVGLVHGKPHQSRLIVLRRDPFSQVPAPVALSPTRLRLGVVEDGRDFVIDFQTNPHLLIAGATGSGKSGTETAMLAAWAPTDVAVCLIDLKHGVSAEPYRPRASVIADTQPGAVDLLGQLLDLGRARALVCKRHGVDSVYDLPEQVRPVEVFVVVDEVAELGIDTGQTDSKQLARQGMGNLLRCVQLLRAFGIHKVISGQRFGSALGPQITNIRAQLPGRVCLRVSDDETAAMVVGDISRDAVRAALEIPETLPGVAIVKGGPDRWQRVRLAKVTHAELARIALANSTHRIDWTDLLDRELHGLDGDVDGQDQVPVEAGSKITKPSNRRDSVKEAA